MEFTYGTVSVLVLNAPTIKVCQCKKLHSAEPNEHTMFNEQSDLRPRITKLKQNNETYFYLNQNGQQITEIFWKTKKKQPNEKQKKERKETRKRPTTGIAFMTVLNETIVLPSFVWMHASYLPGNLFIF